MIDCGVVNDRSMYMKNGFEGALDACIEARTPHQQRRIYSDEIPMASKENIEYIKMWSPISKWLVPNNNKEFGFIN